VKHVAPIVRASLSIALLLLSGCVCGTVLSAEKAEPAGSVTTDHCH
jgi:hypothetical protein